MTVDDGGGWVRWVEEGWIIGGGGWRRVEEGAGLVKEGGKGWMTVEDGGEWVKEFGASASSPSLLRRLLRPIRARRGNGGSRGGTSC